MNIESLRNYCLSFPLVEEAFPFDNETLVFKIGGKIFLLTNIFSFDGFNVKCDPEKAIQQRESYHGILPGYHMNKKHWNTVKTGMDVSDSMMHTLIKDSYQLVFQSLPKKIRDTIQ